MATTLTKKPVGFFQPDPNQPRKLFDQDELAALGESLKKKQHVPLLAMVDGKLLDGHRRLLAAKRVGLLELDALITDEPLSPSQIKEIQLVTALHRTDLTPYEQYVGCRDWASLNPGCMFKDLAAKLDRDPSTLVRIFSLSKCIPAVQQAAAEGKLGPSEWYAISKVPEAEQQAMLAAKLTGANRDELEKRARKLRSNGEANAVKVNKLVIRLAQGRTVTIAGINLSMDDCLESLSEALKSGRRAQSDNLDGKTWERVMKRKAKAKAGA